MEGAYLSAGVSDNISHELYVEKHTKTHPVPVDSMIDPIEGAEKQHLDRFSECYNQFPGNDQIEIIDPDTERPDAILHVSGQVIGLEHTRLFHTSDGPGGQAWERHLEKVAAVAEQRMNERGLPGSVVWISPRRSTGDRTLFDGLAEDLVDLIEEHLPERGGSRDVYWTDAPFLLETPVRRLSIFRGRNDDAESDWSIFHSDAVPNLHPELIQERIDRKAEKLKDYRVQQPGCEEYWLLIAAPGKRPSSWFSPSEAIHSYPFSSPFDRTFVLNNKVGDPELVELSPAHS